MKDVSKGMCTALQPACKKPIGVTGFDSLLVKTSSIVTDGATAITGSKGGLWTLLDEIRIKAYDRIHKSDKTHRKPVIQGQKSQLCPRVRHCGVVGSTLAFEYIGHGFESDHRLCSHHGVSAFSKQRSLTKCSSDDSIRRLL